MKILITGAAGALGRNLVENLKTIRDGKNRTRPNLSIDTIYEYSRSNTGWTHNIINLSDTEDLVTVMWASEMLDKNRPDTFFEKV